MFGKGGNFFIDFGTQADVVNVLLQRLVHAQHPPVALGRTYRNVHVTSSHHGLALVPAILVRPVKESAEEGNQARADFVYIHPVQGVDMRSSRQSLHPPVQAVGNGLETTVFAESLVERG